MRRKAILFWVFFLMAGICRGQKDESEKPTRGVVMGPELALQNGHSNSVSSVAFSPEGKILASGSEDNTIKLWEVGSWRLLRTLEGNPGSVYCLAISPDGSLLAAGSGKKSLVLWDLRAGKLVRTMEGHTRAVWSVAFTPDGKTLASASLDKTVRLWNVETGEEKKVLNLFNSKVLSVAISPDGKLLATGSFDRKARIFELSSGKLLHTLEGHGEPVWSVAFHPREKILASASGGVEENTIKFWNSETGELIRTLPGHLGWVTAVVFSPDGKLLYSASAGMEDHTIKAWDVVTGLCQRILEGHRDTIRGLAVSPTGNLLASASADRTVMLWDTTTGQALQTLAGHSTPVVSVYFTMNDKVLAVSSQDCYFMHDHQLKVGQGGKSHLLRTKEDKSLGVLNIIPAPQGKILDVGKKERVTRHWNLESGRILLAKEKKFDTQRSLAFGRGKARLSIKDDQVLTMWETGTARQLFTMDTHFILTPEWKAQYTGGWDRDMDLVEKAGGDFFQTITDKNPLKIVALSRDGKFLASVRKNQIRLHTLFGKEEDRILTGHYDCVTSLAFSNDGRFLVSGSKDTTIRLWDTKKAKLLLTLLILDREDWVVFTPDGYFDASENAKKFLGWTEDMKAAPPEKFFSQYHKPGLLGKVMRGAEP